MQLTPIRTRPLRAPKDDLKDALRRPKLRLKEGDIVAISSKVVSIDEGRCVPIEGTDKEKLVKREADWYFEAPKNRYRKRFTIAKGMMASSAGIDQSNGNGHFILYPEDPFGSAKRLHAWLKKEYGVKQLGVVITDSTSVPLRRGAIGSALAWHGFNPLKDYRKAEDIFGRPFRAEVANIAEGLAAAATVAMGEGSERTPVVIVRGAAVEFGAAFKEPVIMAPQGDVFAPFFSGKGWRKGGGR